MSLIKSALIVAMLFSQHPSAASVGGNTFVATGRETLHDDTQAEARQIWEQAIAAKGGRERLQAVSSIVIASKATEGHVRREEVCVLPDRYWFWDDQRPTVLGLSIYMFDYGNQSSYLARNGERNDPELTKDSMGHGALVTEQIDFLLESRWVKPDLLRARADRIGRGDVDVVETMAGGERVDFAFDKKTHLPVQVTYYDVVGGKTYPRVHSFSDYVDVDGIKVPTRLKYTTGPTYEVKIEFNVQYDEDIFHNPPPAEAGPEAWRPKTKE